MGINSELVVAVISTAGATGLVSGVVSYVKDRQKDLATAKLTDVQALQQQVALMEQVTKFLREENTQLQEDYSRSEDARRAMREHLTKLEDELQKVKRNAAQTQYQCELLSQQLKEFIAGDTSRPPISLKEHE